MQGKTDHSSDESTSHLVFRSDKIWFNSWIFDCTENQQEDGFWNLKINLNSNWSSLCCSRDPSMGTEFQQSCPNAQAAFGRHLSEEDPRSGWEYDVLLLGCWVWDSFELQEDPRKGPHLPSFPTLVRLGGSLWCSSAFLMTKVEIFFGRDEDIWHCLCGIVAAFWRFGIWTKKLLELISSYFHNGQQ